MKKITLIVIIVFAQLQLLGQNWHQIQKVVPFDRGQIDRFGAAVDIDGDNAVSASWNHDLTLPNMTVKNDAGAAYFYKRNWFGNWDFLQKVYALDAEHGDHFGFKIALDGSNCLVGARHQATDANSQNIKTNAGAAYVYSKDSSGIWINTQKIVASDRDALDNFSESLALNGDYAIIGADQEDHDVTGGNTITDAGAAYIFERNSAGTWIEVQKIVASDRSMDDAFGHAVAISGDYAAVGAKWEDHDVNGNNFLFSSGSVYIFERNINGNWIEVQKVTASDRSDLDIFGTRIHMDGGNLLVSAWNQDTDQSGSNPMIDAGAVYLFSRDTSGLWIQEQKVVPSDRDTSDSFGNDVDIDGNKFIVGCSGHEYDQMGSNPIFESGVAYIFSQDSTGIWVESQKLVAADRGFEDRFGEQVAIGQNSILVGAFADQDDVQGNNPIKLAGSCYFFEYGPVGVGIDEHISNQEIILYPNPSDGELSILLSAVVEKLSITITNMTSQNILRKTSYSTDKLDCNISAPAGIYVANIYVNDVIKTNRRIVIW